MMDLLTGTFYGHSIIFIAVLLLDLLLTMREDEGTFIHHGLMLFIPWYLIEFILVLQSDTFFISIAHLTAASLLVFLVYILLTLLSIKISGEPRGDGWPAIYFGPPVLYLYILVITLILKLIAFVWHYLVSLI